jgi:hypothetical protein
MNSKSQGTRKYVCYKQYLYQYSISPITAGNTFQDLLQLYETVDSTEHYV